MSSTTHRVDSFGITFVDGIHLPSLEAFHDHILATASEIVEAGGECNAPMLFVLGRDGQLAVIPCGGFQKQAIMNFQQAVVRDPMVRACAVVCEAWTSEQKKGRDDPDPMKPKLMPVDDPDRGEVILVSILTAGRQAMTFSKIKRPSNKVHKVPFKWLDEQTNKHSGRFVR